MSVELVNDAAVRKMENLAANDNFVDAERPPAEEKAPRTGTRYADRLFAAMTWIAAISGWGLPVLIALLPLAAEAAPAARAVVVALGDLHAVTWGYLSGAAVYGFQFYRAWKTASGHAPGEAIHFLHDLLLAILHIMFP
jgi:hypothetical protein